MQSFVLKLLFSRQILCQAIDMRVRRRAPAGGPAPIEAGYWLLALVATLAPGAGQVCKDFSVDTGAYWWVCRELNSLLVGENWYSAILVFISEFISGNWRVTVVLLGLRRTRIAVDLNRAVATCRLGKPLFRHRVSYKTYRMFYRTECHY